MKICFCARPNYDKLSSKLYLSIKTNFNSNLEATFITNDKLETKYIEDHINNAEVYEIASFFEKNWDEFTHDKLHFFEQEYNCSPIWKYIYTDRFLINYDYDYCVKTTVGLFMFFKQIFSAGGIDYYYDETIATLQSYIAYIVGKKHGVDYISQMTARGKDSTHHYFLNDPYEYNMNFNNEYKQLNYDENIVDIASEFLERFEETNFKPANMVFTGKKPSFKLNYFLLIGLWVKNRTNPKFNNKYSYMYYKGYKSILNPLLFYFRYKISQNLYQKPDYSKKYVYFPLHYQPEASTIVCAQKYEKQIFYIDSWAKSLPADTMLYIKEHYALLGHRELGFYKQLKKYPNVVLIDPWEDTFKLIKNAIAVTTLTGTAGWEAMLLRKPVILGGNIFFDNAPGIIKVDDIFDNFVNKLEQWIQPTREEIIHYLCEYFSTIYEGQVYAASPNCYDEKNIYKVAESLINQIERLEVKKCLKY
ncbi:MAG: hypothetical protein PHR67_08135 [Candidatus Cloacimonetes bacterium]|nr:hypothetical protein [Candidatus Cloacimonadota bacterium]